MRHEADRKRENIDSRKVLGGCTLWMGKSIVPDRSGGTSKVDQRIRGLCSWSPLMEVGYQ